MKKELKCLEENPEVNILMDSLRETLKKIPNKKTQGYYGIHGFWFLKIHVQPRQIVSAAE